MLRRTDAVNGARNNRGHSIFSNVPPREVTFTTTEQGLDLEFLDDMDRFACHLFRNRIAVVKLSAHPMSRNLPKFLTTPDGGQFELLSRKSSKIKQSGKLQIAVMYVLISGPDIQPINLQEELEKVAGFGKLKPAKIASRLELFQSTACKSNRKGQDYLIFSDLTSDDFELIDEHGNEGCGFLPREYVYRFLGSYAVGKWTFAVQVRIFASRLGVFKGVLEVKPGINKIQLPPSMMKVGPSICSCDNATLLINAQFPNSSHLQIAKILSGQNSAKSFRPKGLSPMLLPLLESLGVPKNILQQYGNKVRRRLQHAHLVGLADPTGALSSGHVFMTGILDAPTI